MNPLKGAAMTPSTNLAVISANALAPNQALALGFPAPASWSAEPTLREVFEFYRIDPTRRHAPWSDTAYGYRR
jgi:hypothetical protein